MGVLRVDIYGWHHAVALEDGDAHPVIIGGSPAGKGLLPKDTQHGGPMQGVGVAIVVALRATGLKDSVTVRLLCIELVERRGWRGRWTAAGQDWKERAEQANEGTPRSDG